MNSTFTRIAVASSCLLLAGVTAASSAAAAPTMVPRHPAVAMLAPPPGPVTVDTPSGGCGAGRFAARCSAPAAAAVPASVPMAAQHVLEADVNAVVIPESVAAAASVTAQGPIRARNAMAEDLEPADSVVHAAPHAAMGAMHADLVR